MLVHVKVILYEISLVAATKLFFLLFILKIIESGVTEFDTKGAYSHKRRKMLMCVVPTEKYTLLKNAIHEIDSDAFIVVSDCYEVLGGTKRKKLSFDN